MVTKYFNLIGVGCVTAGIDFYFCEMLKNSRYFYDEINISVGFLCFSQEIRYISSCYENDIVKKS